MKPRIALCDCNNFFVSCERLYRPSIRNRPVVVLSSNDGCIVSRSNEVKALGIPNGTPYFQVQNLLRAKGVAVCSGNLPMYAEISRRVMKLLGRLTPALEVYSIDEAFLDISFKSQDSVETYAHEIRRKVSDWIGIPVSIGIATSKTLAKLAAGLSKSGSGVLNITESNRQDILEATDIGDVWGIGRKRAESLRRAGVLTAADFVRKKPDWIKRVLTVGGVITVYELMGYACTPIQTEEKPPKTIQSSRTFGQKIEELDLLRGAVIDNVLRAGHELRKYNLAASVMEVFVRHGYRHSGEYGYHSEELHFGEPTCSDHELRKAALGLLSNCYKEGYSYTKSGVSLSRLGDARYRQRLLLDSEQQQKKERHEKLSQAIDEINAKLGRSAVVPAILALKEKVWRPQKSFGR